MIREQLVMICFWYLMVVEVSAVSSNKKEDNPLDKLLDKQHDYKIKFERAEKVRFDKQYIKILNIVTFKYNRTTPLVNASIMYNLDVGHQLEVILQIYKFASNEYREFPIRFQANFCQAFKKNVFGLGQFSDCGNFKGCPILKDIHYFIRNWAPNTTMFPPFIPDGQYMAELQAMYHSIELFVLRGYGTIFRPVEILN